MQSLSCNTNRTIPPRSGGLWIAATAISKRPFNASMRDNLADRHQRSINGFVSGRHFHS
jgi:hypothetical protein